MESQKNKSLYVWILVALILGFFAYSMWRPSPASNEATRNLVESVQPISEDDETMTQPTTNETTSPTSTATDTPAMVANKEVVIEATNFKYDMTEIRVKKGDTVKLTLKVTQGFHDWVVDEFNAKTSQMQAEGTETITFVADKAGTFEYYCSVGQHRQMGMVGKLIVE